MKLDGGISVTSLNLLPHFERGKRLVKELCIYEVHYIVEKAFTLVQDRMGTYLRIKPKP